MKKFLDIFVPFLLCAAVIAFSSILPMAIFGKNNGYDTPDDSKSPVGIKRAEFLARSIPANDMFDYKYYTDIDDSLRQKALDTVFSFTEQGGLPGFLTSEMSELYSNAVVEKVKIKSKAGAQLSLIHIYLEWMHDWSNWLEIYMDAKDFSILYLYSSGSCKTSHSAYANQYPIVPKLEMLTQTFAERSGYTIMEQSYLKNPNENAIEVKFSDGVNTAKYKINCIYYAGTMYDIKFAPLP